MPDELLHLLGLSAESVVNPGCGGLCLLLYGKQFGLCLNAVQDEGEVAFFADGHHLSECVDLYVHGNIAQLVQSAFANGKPIARWQGGACRAGFPRVYTPGVYALLEYRFALAAGMMGVEIY